MKKTVFLIIIVLCSQCKSIESEIIDDEFKSSDSTIFNYDDASKKYTIESINAHFDIHIEIDKPYVIKAAEIELDSIYSISEIEGIAIFNVSLSNSGKIIDFEIIKSAGLKLDETAAKIIKGLRISPASKEGINYKSSANISIEFTGKEVI